TIASAELPADVCIPNGFSDVAIDYFDDYSWRDFVALVWPAARPKRGVADTAKTVGDNGPRVFETFKSLGEVFHDDGSAPTSSFHDFDPAAGNPCNVAQQYGDVLLAPSKAWADIGQAGAGDLLGPLVAQNGRYVRVQTLYNQAAYDFLVRNKFYLRSNLPSAPGPVPSVPVMQFPFGSTVVKAAWLDMTGFSEEQRRRFYTRTAILRDPDNGKCSNVTVALVGMHIATKTPSRPQWTWSTYEQADLVPPAEPGAPGKFILNDGTDRTMPEENVLPLVPLAPQPAHPFNVVRSMQMPIHPNTVSTNNRYRKLLKGTAWENYQLVMTQWERVPGNQALPIPASLSGDASNTFPGVGAGSAFANLTMETFDQNRVQLGCMNCHNKARLNGDFMWSVLDHAYPPVIAPAPSTVQTTGGGTRGR
ncbi:MAG TPA: hypothetical protein VGH38_15200, partial [Bryobacteraceae bacterium]